MTITGAYEGGHWVHVPPLGGHEWGDSFMKWFYIMWGKIQNLTLKGKSFSSFFNIFQTLENNFSSFLILFTQTFCNYNPKIFLIFRTNKPNPYFLETWWCKPNRIHSLKYQKSTTLGCRDIGIIILSLWQNLISFAPLIYIYSPNIF